MIEKQHMHYSWYWIYYVFFSWKKYFIYSEDAL